MSSRQRVTLESVCSLIADCPHSTPAWTETGFLVIRNQNIKNGKLDLSERSYTDHEHYLIRVRRAKPQFGDLILTREAPMGEVCMVPEGLECCVGQRQVLLRPDPAKIVPRFLLYAIQSPEVQHEISWSEGTGSTVSNIRIPVLQSIKIPLIPLKEQTEIATLLGALDDRITLLRETNATLEAIAQALFKSWFVDFDPVHAKQQGRAPEGMDEATAALFPDSFEESELGLVPRGWRARIMDEVSVVGIGKTPPRKEPQWFSESTNDVRWVSIRDMGISGAFISQTSEYLTAESIERFNVRQVPNNTALLSFKMTIGRVALTDGEMTTNEAIAHFKLDNQSPLTSEFIYLHLKQFDYSSLSSTSSIADAVNSKTVKAIPILVPDAAILLAFQKVAGSVFGRIKLIQQQAQTLTTLRDTLLPRLISGQLRLPEAEAQLEEAAAVIPAQAGI
ncbi:MAG: restriction endonuclease subunit S [Methylococcaceae bacterium]|nr:restriction endonuclease subunit S [Methylococcaceae bacterium]